MVTMDPWRKPKASRTTLTMGTRQLVVHDAFDTMWCLALSYLSLFTPMTMVMSSPLAGAEMMTFFAPPLMCLPASSAFVKRPVDSSTMSTPRSFHGSAEGSFSAKTRTSSPSTQMPLAEVLTSPSVSYTHLRAHETPEHLVCR